MSDKDFPNPEDIQKEFEQFVKKRFGSNVQVIAQPFGASKRSHEEKKSAPDSTANQDLDSSKIRFDLQPKEVKAHLDRYVIGQDDAKKALAIAVCDHYNHVQSCLEGNTDGDFEYAKQNVLILGPTGVGKSYLIKQLAKLIGVPFVKADATRFSETGYVGANVDDLVKDLVKQADENLDLAQFGIIYLDEADKLAGGSHSGRDVSGRGVQFGLLKLMEETEVDLRSGNDVASQMQAFMDFQRKGKVERKVINTKHILFIVSGAFTGLEEIIAERLNTNRIGFAAESVDAPDASEALFRFASTNDFLKYGLEPEFIGRLPIRVSCNPLSTEDLFDILKNSEGSIIRQYQRSFAAYGIEVDFTDEALQKIASLAYEQKTGARALLTVCEDILREFKFELPATTVRKFSVTGEVVENPKDQLQKLLDEPQNKAMAAIVAELRDYEQRFTDKHQTSIRFHDGAIQEIAKRVDFKAESIEAFCDQCLQSYEHGLKLVYQNTGRSDFLITREVISQPRAALEKWIKDSYTEADEKKS